MHVLVAEDDALISMSLCDGVAALGADVVGPARTVQRALELLGQSTPDAAILDYGLMDGPAEPVARLLSEKSVPYALLTGYDVHDVPSPGATMSLTKPVRWPVLEAFLMEVMRRR